MTIIDRRSSPTAARSPCGSSARAAGSGIRTVAVYTDADRRRARTCAPPTSAPCRAPSRTSTSTPSSTAAVERRRRRGAPRLRLPLRARRLRARASPRRGLTFVGPSRRGDGADGPQGPAREIADGGRRAGGAARAPWPTTGRSAFPVLVKAAAGGGGKGMRIVRAAAELEAAVAAARREASSAFGDDTILVERYVEHGRHVEVQVLADPHGNVAPPLRARLLDPAPPPEGARGGARADDPRGAADARHRRRPWPWPAHVGYENAGTVEFLARRATPARSTSSR